MQRHPRKAQREQAAACLASHGIVLMAVDSTEEDGVAIVVQVASGDDILPEGDLCGFHVDDSPACVLDLQGQAVHVRRLCTP